MNQDRQKKAEACGVMLVDKPAGMSSHDVVYALRRLTGIKKVGHGGTLDPFATGLLLMLIGKATRLFDYLAPLKKDYRVTAQFGAVSTTGDIDGDIEPVAGPLVNAASLEREIPRFTGIIKQQVPVYSAVKVGGMPLYKRARAGHQVEAPVREVEISGLELVSMNEANQQAVLDVSCSKGTYIRQLCADLGEVLGSGAYAASLRRTAVGELTAGQASTLPQLEALPRASLLTSDNPSFISCLGALYFLPVRELEKNEARAVEFGRAIEGAATGPVRLASEGRLLAIYGPAAEPGLIKPLLVLA